MWTRPQTGAKTIHCAAKLSTQCNNSLFPFYWPFSRWTWLADTRTYLHSGFYWMMDVEVVTDTIRCAQLKSKSSTNQHPVFQAGHPSCRPTKSTGALKGKPAVVHKSCEQVQYRASHDTAETVYQPWSGLWWWGCRPMKQFPTTSSARKSEFKQAETSNVRRNMSATLLQQRA